MAEGANASATAVASAVAAEIPGVTAAEAGGGEAKDVTAARFC